jgi:hypothetical protein
VPAFLVVRRSASISALVEQHPGRESPQARDADFLQHDDRCISGPLHLDWHRYSDVDVVELDSGRDRPQIAVAQLRGPWGGKAGIAEKER